MWSQLIRRVSLWIALLQLSQCVFVLWKVAGSDIEDELKASGLRNVTLENTSGKGIAYTIQWMQTGRRLAGCKEQYRKCKYVSPTGLEVAVFVAEISGAPPERLQTNGYNSVLHVGSAGGNIFFVVHPREWMPYKHRFMPDQEIQEQQRQWLKTNIYLGSSSYARVLSEALVGDYLHYIG